MTPLNLDPNRNYLAEAGTQVDIPEWRKSLSAFGQETKALGSGLKALGAQALGADEARDAALADYQHTMEGAQSGWRTPDVGKIEDIKFGESGGLGRFGEYLGFQVPKGIAQLGLTIAGGLGGGAVAKGLASKGVKELAKREIKDMALDRAKKRVMTPALQREAAQVALKKQAQRQALGTTVGGIGTGAAMEGGQTYGQFANDPEIGPEAAVGPTLAYAGVAGALEWLPIAQGAKAIGLDRTLLRKVIKKDPKLSAEAVKLSKKQRAAKLAAKVGGAAVAGAAVEGLTEGVQNLAQLAAERYAKEDSEWASILPRTPEEWSETWNAAAAGAATGFFARGATAPFAGTKQPEPQPEPEPEPVVGEQPPVTPPPVEPLIGPVANNDAEGSWSLFDKDGVQIEERLTEADAQKLWKQYQAEQVQGQAQGQAEPTPVPGAEAPSTAAPQADQGTQPETAQESAGQVGVEPGVVELAGQVASEVRVELTEDGTWRVVDNAGQVVGVGMTEPEAVEVRGQEIEERAQRGQVVSTTGSPQPQAAPQEPITPKDSTDPLGWVDDTVKRLAAVGEQSGNGDKIADLAAQYKTTAEIAQELGIDKNVVQAVKTVRSIPSWTTQLGPTIGGNAGPVADPSQENPEFTKWRAAWLAQNTTDSTTNPPVGVLDALSMQEDPATSPGVLGEETVAQGAAQAAPTEQVGGGRKAKAGAVKAPVEVIRKTDGTAFGSREAAIRRLNQLWNKGELTIQKGKNTGKQARVRVVAEGNGFVIEKLESLPAASSAAIATVPDTDSEGRSVYPTEEGRQNFKKWFAGSKVVDEAGHPKRVYHGTMWDFDAFKKSELGKMTRAPSAGKGFFFSGNPDTTATYSKQYPELLKRGVTEDLQPNTMPLWLDIKNPLVHDFGGKKKRSESYNNLLKEARAAGHDGAIFKNTYDGGPQDDIYVAFEPEQIKSAVGNRGTFEEGSPSVLESRGTSETGTAKSAIDFVAEADGLLGQGWTQRAIDAGILKVNETSPEGKAYGTLNLKTGQIDINLDKFKEGQSALSTLLHENSHASMKQMLGKQFDQFHADLLKLAQAGSETASKAMRHATQGLARAINNKEGMTPISHQLDDPSLSEAEHRAELERVRGVLQERFPEYLKEEEMAYYVQLAAEGNPTEAGYWNRLKTAIQAWIAQTNFGKAMATIGWGPEMSEQLAVELAKQAAKRTVQRAELVNQLLSERGKVLGNLSAGQRVGVLESSQQTREEVGLKTPASWYRSGVQDVVEGSPQSKARGPQWLGWLKKQPGVKQEELDDLGLDDWLEAQPGVVTKEQIVGFVEAGGVKIEETLKAPDQYETLLARQKELTDKDIAKTITADELVELDKLEQLLMFGEYSTPSRAETQYGQYQTPGGQNYRELLITVPTTSHTASFRLEPPDNSDGPVATQQWQILEDGAIIEFARSEQQAQARIEELKGEERFGDDTYRSGHWDEPNVLVHLRFNERTDAEGKQVLFVEEVQSDWHQEGRKKGYGIKSEADLEKEEQELSARRGSLTPTEEERRSALYQYLEFGTGPLAGLRDAPPNAPLKSSWALLGMKRAIRWGAEHGFDKIGWTADPQTLKNVGGWTDLEQQGDKWIADGDQNVTSIVNRYLRDLPRALNKYGKKFGARAEKGVVPLNEDQIALGIPIKYNIKAAIEQGDAQEIWTLPLTPKLRDEALAGQLLYSLPPLRDLKERHTWFTSPASTMPEDYNVPGVFNKVLHGLVDRFEYVKGKSANLYRAFDEWKNRQGALQQEIQRTYLDPMRQLVSQYKPGEKDLDPIYSTDVANGKDKPIDQYTTVEIVGHQLAARHIIEDKVTEKLALKAAPKFLKELKKALTPHDVGLLNADIKQITGGSVDIKKLSGPQAKKLFETYLATLPASSKVKQDLSERWVLYNRRSAGYSIAKPGSIEAQMDAIEGFINAHDLYTPGVQGRKSFQRIAELSDQLAEHQLKMLQEGGMLTQEAVDRLQGAYKHYVPLRREAFDYDQELAKMFEKPKSGVGKMMTRKGSISKPSAVHVLQNHLAAGFTAASAAARNQMMNKFYDEVNQDRNGWKPWFRFSEKRDNNGALGLIRNGKPLYIVPKEGNLRAASIAKVISGQDAQELSGPLRIMRTVNSWIRWSNVSASPAFILANTPRDYLTAAYNLKASDAADYEKEIRSWTNYKDSFKALHKVIVQGVRESSDPQEQQWIELVEDFEKAGGKTSFVEALRAMDGDSWKSFEAQVGRRQGKLKEVVNFGADKLEWIENLNIALENVMRLSTYKVMRDKVGKERAAEIARNLTTNFTRRGAHVDAINTWWLFYNATVQGNWQVVQNLFLNPNKAGQTRLRKAVGGTILFAFMIDQLGRALSDDEDEDGIADWDARPDWEKERKISSPIAVGGVYPSIPAPWVFNVFWRMGGMLGEVKDGVLKPQDATLDLVGLTTSAMNPIGGGTAAQTITPSALDPLMQIVENKNFVGNPLGPDGYPGAGARPDAYLAWDSTPGAYKSAAEFVNGLTGGSPVESGAVDVRPSSVKVLTDFALGGLGRTMLDLGKLGMSPFNDDLGFDGPEKVPGLKTFLSAPSDSTAISKYHDRAAKVLGADRLIKLYSEGAERDPEKLAEVQRDRAAVLRMVPQVKDTERQIKSLRKTMRSAQARGDSRTEKLLRDRITELQKRFNKSYTRRIES